MTEHLIVDVFNLAHGLVRSRGKGPDIESLVYELESYCALSGKRLVLVFDGTRFKGEIASTKTLDALFSKPGEPADAVVERFMTGVPPNERLSWIVVSDDVALKRMAAGMGMRTQAGQALMREVRSALDTKRRSATSHIPKPFNNPFEKL